MTPDQDILDQLADLVARARRAGADAADAVLIEGVGVSHAQRLGQIEKLERSEGYDLGLRVLIGRRQAIVSSNDRTSSAMTELVERAIAMARIVPEDPYCGLADANDITHGWPVLDSVDPVEPSAEILIARAQAAEAAARAVAGVSNSEGAEAGWSSARIAMVASNGFAGGYSGSGHSISVSVLAGEGDGMERDYDWSSAVYGGDLEAPELLGQRAGERAVRRLGARRGVTGKAPVVFDPRVAGGMIGHLIGAISGPSVARGTSFLKDKLGQRIFPETITIIDDPHRARGMRSKPFDGEGLANRRSNLIENGVLATWILDLRSARQLGLASTGHASRGTGGPPSPSPTNVHMAPGTLSPRELMADIVSGFYVTDLMGQGVNGVTGDYSRGASGFWIENGEITFPVNEMTIAGNLRDIFATITPANDLVFRGAVNAPTLRIEGMMIAGN